MARPNKRAVVLLSGGLDSCVTGTIAKCEGYGVHALTVDYGQRHAREIQAAEAVAKALRATEHKAVKVDLTAFGGSALTDDAIDVPERAEEEIEGGIPATYVPARNTILLALALAHAEVAEAQAIFIGVNAMDYSGYPDCRPAFIDAMNAVAAVATKQAAEDRPVKIHSPLIDWNKARIVQEGVNLRAPIKHTWSCYRGGEKACGRCDSCLLRLKGFREAGVEDPAEYET